MAKKHKDDSDQDIDAIRAFCQMRGDRLPVRVTPGASSARITLETDEAQPNDARLRLYVTTIPEDGKANKDALKMLAKTLGLPRSRLEIITGATSRDKTIRIDWP